MLLECLEGQRDPAAQNVLQDQRIGADLVLRMAVGAQPYEVFEQVMSLLGREKRAPAPAEGVPADG